MNEDSMKRGRVLNALRRALEDWTRRGNEQPLTRWLSRELDAQGAPIRLPIPDWPECVASLLNAKHESGVWPAHWNDAVTRLVQTTLWFTRRDGSPVTVFNATKAKQPGHRAFGELANGSRGRGVLKDWMSSHKYAHTSEGRLVWGGSKQQALDVIRPGWPDGDDFLAIDHRDVATDCHFELFGAGQSWLGPQWSLDLSGRAKSPPRPSSGHSTPSGIFVEWSYRSGRARVTLSALMLGEQALALLSAVIESPAAVTPDAAMRLSLAPGVDAGPCENSRGLVLKPSNKRGSAQVLPIGLPALPYPTERGTFLANDGAVILKQTSAGRRCWLPLLVSWDSKRHRKAVSWRVLSVSEKARNVPPDRAFAVRVSWGRDETYVIYRSFAKPAPRAFLGHQTTARLLVGRFTQDGAVEPIFTID